MNHIDHHDACRASEQMPPYRISDGGHVAIAARNIIAGETIKFLAGEIVSTLELMRRIAAKATDVDTPHQIDEDSYLLLDEASKAFGHCCSPNAGVAGANRLFAIKDILLGESIRFDFSTAVGLSHFDAVWSMKCDCGAPNCRQELGSVRTIPVDTFRSYIKMGALPDFILRQVVSLKS